MNALRKPRLTEHRLADLRVAIDALDGEIEYLASALAGALTDVLRERMRARHAALQRSATWLRGLVDAVHEQRGLPP